MKPIVTTILLLFVAGSIAFMLVRDTGTTSSGEAGIMATEATGPKSDAAMAAPAGERSTSGTEVLVYYFHGDFRCKKCLAMEAFAREAVAELASGSPKDGGIEWHAVNFDKPDNRHFVEQYGLTSSAVVVVRMEQGKPVRWKNLEEIWDLVADEVKYKQYIASESIAMLERGS